MTEVCLSFPSTTLNVILGGVVVTVILAFINIFCPFASNFIQNRSVLMPTNEVLKTMHDNLQVISRRENNPQL